MADKIFAVNAARTTTRTRGRGRALLVVLLFALAAICWPAPATASRRASADSWLTLNLRIAEYTDRLTLAEPQLGTGNYVINGFKEQYSYEPTGELTSVLDRLNRSTTMAHDQLGRLKRWSMRLVDRTRARIRSRRMRRADGQADERERRCNARGNNANDTSSTGRHLFSRSHQLDDRVGRFDADPLIANAWQRLENGTHNANDIALLRHEIFESRFESIFKTDYRTAHDATLRSGRTWDPHQ